MPRGHSRAPESKDPRDITDLAKHDDALDTIISTAEGDPVAIARGLQARFGFVPRNALAEICRRAGWRPGRLYSVISFYTALHLVPRGRHIVRVCHGTACHVTGAERISEHLQQHLGIDDGETTEDMAFSLERVGCVGCCSLAPVMVVGERTWGRLDRGLALDAVNDLRAVEAGEGST